MSMEDIFTTEEFKVTEDGKRIKVTRKIQQVIKVEKVHKSVAEQKQWQKFGNSANDKPGPNESTTVLVEEVFLKLSMEPAPSEEESTMAETLNKVKNKVIICRYCKGEHWSTKCPFKNHALMLSGKEDISKRKYGD